MQIMWKYSANILSISPLPQKNHMQESSCTLFLNTNNTRELYIYFKVCIEHRPSRKSLGNLREPWNTFFSSLKFAMVLF